MRGAARFCLEMFQLTPFLSSFQICPSGACHIQTREIGVARNDALLVPFVSQQRNCTLMHDIKQIIVSILTSVSARARTKETLCGGGSKTQKARTTSKFKFVVARVARVARLVKLKYNNLFT
jgi:hypothetical protein